MIAMNPLFQSAHNQELGLRIENALMRSDPDQFQGLAVRAFYGIVEISGTVANASDARLAIRIAERIPGVTTVVQDLRVGTRKRDRPGSLLPDESPCHLSGRFKGILLSCDPIAGGRRFHVQD